MAKKSRAGASKSSANKKKGMSLKTQLFLVAAFGAMAGISRLMWRRARRAAQSESRTTTGRSSMGTSPVRFGARTTSNRAGHRSSRSRARSSLGQSDMQSGSTDSESRTKTTPL